MAGSGWSLERVVSELRQHAGGEVITYAALRAAGYGALVSAADRYVGSFSRAIKLAGIEPARLLWTRDRVLAEIKRLHRKGVELNSQQLANGGHAGFVQAARRHFGSWPDAVTAAGAPRFKRGRWKTWEQVRDQLRELHRKGIRMTIAMLEANGLRDLVDAAQAEAGNWNAALAKAKVPLVQEHLAWSSEQVLEGIRALNRDGVALNANMIIARGDRKLVKAAGRRRVGRRYRTTSRWCSAGLASGYFAKSATVIARTYRCDRPKSRRRRRGLRKPRGASAFRGARCRRAGIPKSAIAPRQSSPVRVRWDEEKIFAELEKAVRAGRPLLTRSFRGAFVTAVLRRYASWPHAMEAAGWARQYARDHAEALANRLGGATLRAKP